MKMSGRLTLVVSTYVAVAYWLGIPIPPQPFLTLAGLLSSQLLLSIYSDAIAHLLHRPSGASSTPPTESKGSFSHLADIDKTRWAFLTITAIGTFALAEGILFSSDGRWTGPTSDNQIGLAFSIAILEFLVLFFYLMGKLCCVPEDYNSGHTD
jgi:hypothetical protein